MIFKLPEAWIVVLSACTTLPSLYQANVGWGTLCDEQLSSSVVASCTVRLNGTWLNIGGRNVSLCCSVENETAADNDKFLIKQIQQYMREKA